MTTAPVSSDQLRNDVASALANYRLSVDEFLSMDVDDLETDELRDLWLMVEAVLSVA